MEYSVLIDTLLEPAGVGEFSLLERLYTEAELQLDDAFSLDSFPDLDGRQRWFLAAGRLGAYHGQAALKLKTRAAVSASADLFQAEIRLREHLPWQEAEEFRNDLAGAWMNHGDALLEMWPGRDTLEEAIESFERAIELQEGFPSKERDVVLTNLAGTWINRGRTLMALGTPYAHLEALSSFGHGADMISEQACTKPELAKEHLCAQEGLSKAREALARDSLNPSDRLPYPGETEGKPDTAQARGTESEVDKPKRARVWINPGFTDAAHDALRRMLAQGQDYAEIPGWCGFGVWIAYHKPKDTMFSLHAPKDIEPLLRGRMAFVSSFLPPQE